MGFGRRLRVGGGAGGWAVAPAEGLGQTGVPPRLLPETRAV